MTLQNKIIWIFNQYISLPDMPGGTRHIDIASELVNNGYKVHLFASGFHYLKHKDLILNDKEDFKVEHYQGFFIHWLKIKTYNTNGIKRLISMISFYFALFREVKRYSNTSNFNKPDIIIGSTVHLFTVLAAYKIAKKLKSKFIMEVRDLWPYTFIATRQMSKFHPLVLFFGYLERFLYKKSLKIIVLLDKADEYIGKYVNPDKIVWIPNSFNLNLLKSIDQEIELKPTKNFRVLFAGSINIFNDIKSLVKAFEIVKKKLNDTELVLIGDGMGKENIQAYIQKNNIPDIKLIKSLPKNKILSYLSTADALWSGMPNSDLYKYGISFNKLYDYMAVKKPILLSVPRNTDNIVNTAKCGLIAEAENFHDLAEKIIQLYNMSYVEREQLALNGYNYLLNNFTTQKIIAKLECEILNMV